MIGELQAGRPARGVPAPEDAPGALRDLGSLTAKPVLFVANVDEGAEEVPPEIAAHAAAQGAGAVAVSLTDRVRAGGARGRRSEPDAS